MPPKLTVEKINQEICKEGYTCIAYNIESKKFTYICDKGHEGSIRLDHWRRGVRCAACAGNAKLNIAMIKNTFELEGYKLLDTLYTNSSTLLTTICPEGHEYKISWNNWNSGYRCSVCSGRKIKNLKDIENFFLEENYVLKETTYINNKTPLHCVCSNNHDYFVSWDNWSTKNSRCPRCSNVGISKAELELLEYIKTISSYNVLSNDRTILNNLELDIVIPDLKLAIEYCGLYWHSEARGKNRNYHKHKLEQCLTHGYKLITVFEDEWLTNKDLVKSRLMYLISNENIRKIYARKCIIREVETKTAIEFCNENHLQGYGSGASIKLGAFFNNELVAIMTFSKPSLSKGAKKKEEGVWELHRFCNLKGTVVVGGASRLLKYFEHNYHWSRIFSYADRRWSNGNLYTKLGFIFEGYSQPNYWYFLNNLKRYHRFGLRKKSFEKSLGTEALLRKKEGFNRIWDCGNYKFIKTNKLT